MIPSSASFRQLADGLIELENDRLLIRLDPRQAGSAWSLLDKSSGKDVALCQGYGTRIHPSLVEILAGQPISEGRVDAMPAPFEIKDLRVDETGAAAVTFSGHPVAAPIGSAPLHRVRLDKTCRLIPGRPQVRVDLAFVNESDTALPLAAWISSGVRLPEEDCDVFAPSITGTVRTLSPWHAPVSQYVNIPRATAGWTAAVSQRAPHHGLYLAAADSRVDAIWNWLGKFPGFTLGFGTPQSLVQPGARLAVSYVLGLLRDLPRLDGVSAALAGALEMDDAPAEPGQTRRITVRLTAPEHRTATVRLTRKALGAGGKAISAGPSQRVEIGPDGAASLSFDVPFETADTHVLAATITSGADTLRLERPVTAGLPRFLYRRTPPRVEGKRFWGQLVGDRPLQPRTQRCDRTVRHPMVPWLAPAAGRRLRVFYIGEVSFNTAIYRDLSRRGDFDWGFVNLWGTGDMRTGPYGRTEVERARRKLKRFKPDCVVTAGVRFEDAPAELIEDLWRYAARGGGLLLVGRDEPHCHGIWPGRLASADARPDPIDLAAGLAGLFDAGIAPGPMGTIRPYAVGAGRIILLDKQLDWPVLGPWGDEGPRNDLLPRYRGKTELPDWEYHFAQYLQLIRHAAHVETAATLSDMELAADGLTVHYGSGRAQQACLEYEIVSCDRLRALRGQINVDLAAGGGLLSGPVPPLPANDYVFHAWLLDGHVDTPALEQGDDRLILRERHARPVLDFAAGCQSLASEPGIGKIDIENRRQVIPDAVTVTVVAAHGNVRLPAHAELELEWRNGAFDRVVWRRREPVAGRTEIRFEGIAFAPVSHEGAVAVRLWDGSQLLAERAEPVQAWKPGNVAEEEIAFLTAAGGEYDWYGTRMMRPWAEREAGFDFTYLCYGMKGGGFPWKRGRDNRLDPPIVDERPLRESLARELKHQFVDLGNAYVNMSDEFRLGGEYDWSEPTLAAYCRHLAGLYGTIERLNAQHDTAFASFDDVLPVLLEQARQMPDNPSAWLDFRLFMDGRVNRRYEIATEEAATLSPLFKVGDSGAYAPGVGVGVNFYSMIRASRFTMTYGGLRSDWVRSFLKEGDGVGVWLGYGWGSPVLPWETLFRHYNILAWWGYLLHKRLTAHSNMSMIHLDLTPAEPFREIGRQQREIRNGLGRLIQHARVASPRVLLPYSQSSVYALAVIGESHEEGANAAIGLLNERRLTYRFVADEEVCAQGVGAVLAPPAMSNEPPSTGSASGAPTPSAGLLLLFNTDALPLEAATAYASTIDRGSSVLADAAVGTRDGHGKRLTASALDAAFGVDRGNATLLKGARFEPIRWTDEAPSEWRNGSGQMVRALRGLKVSNGTVWARFEDGEPAVIVKRAAAGSMAVMLNTRLPWMSSNKVAKALNPEDRPDELSPDKTIGMLVDHLLAHARLEPFAGVESGTVKPSMITRFDDGRARYYGLVTDKSAGRMTVELPERAHTYDVRKSRYLGFVKQFDDDIASSDLAKVYAQLPYAVKAIRTNGTQGTRKPGETVTLQGRLAAEDGTEPDQFHVVHAEVIDPSGNRPCWHQVNLNAPAGRFEMTIPLALNAPAGTWRIELRETVSGKRKTVRFSVEEAVKHST